MPTVHVVDAGSPPNIFILPAYNNDFAYSLPRSGERWLALWYADSGTPAETPGMYRSADGGATWTRYGDATAPIISSRLNTPLAYDSRFNTIDPAAQSAITIFYGDDTSTSGAPTTGNMHLVDFNFSTRSYGSPYGAVTLTPLDISFFLEFSSLPGGGFIVVYPKTTGTYFRIYSGGWSGETFLDANHSFGSINLAVDGSGNSHIIVGVRNYYRVDSSGTIVEGPTGIYSSGLAQNLSLVSGNLVLLIAETNQFTIATGSPASGPTWATQTITGVDVAEQIQNAWYAQLSGAYAVDVETDGHSLSYEYVNDFLMPSVSAPTIHWPSTDQSTIYRIIYSSGSWGAPVSIWTTTGPSPVLNVFAVNARRTGGGAETDLSRGDTMHLTRREIQLLVACSEGLSNKEIAARLIMSEGTVKTYKGILTKKLGIDPRSLPVLGERVKGCLTS